MKQHRKPAAFAFTLFAAVSALAMPSITIDSVAQRWPWNNKIDITYTVSGGQNVAAGVYARIVFTANIGGASYTIDGVHDVGADASDGTHTVAYELPSGLQATGCTMTAQLLSADVPSGNDYMVVDLSDGTLTYEGRFATQAESNTRYNTDTYKTSKLVLRKVPKWADRSTLPNAASLPADGYPTGDSAIKAPDFSSLPNTPTTWTTARDYYIGVFPVTKAQYNIIQGNSSTDKTPLQYATYKGLRGATDDDTAIAPTQSIAVVTSNTGTFLQRLNYKTGNKLNFDLPTEVMFEIAERAGVTTIYNWGSSTSNGGSYAHVGNTTSSVGSHLPNNWGLYDTAGWVWEWCLDAAVSGVDMNNRTYRPDAFTPGCSNSANRMRRGGASAYESISNDSTQFRASYRSSLAADNSNARNGFRVSRIAD